MENLKLAADLRKKEETTKELRKEKILAGVVYGKKRETISIKLAYSDFLKTFRKSGMSNIITIKVGKEEIEVLVQQIQKNPVSGDFIHVDFYAITRGEKLTTKIQITFVGESSAVKEGAILEEHVKEIEVKCLPKDLVDSFEVNLEDLKEIGDGIRVSDLKIDSEKFEILSGVDDLIVTAAAPAKIEEVEVTEETAEAGEEAEGTEAETEEK